MTAPAVAPAPFFGLPPDIEQMRREARAFALEHLRPRAAELEWRPAAHERVSWDALEECSRRG